MPRTIAKSIESLHAAALALPDASEGVACAGTTLERRTALVNGKAFLFTGPSDLRFKLAGSLAEARESAVKNPDAVAAGSSGWVTVRFLPNGSVPPAATLKRWIVESHGLFAKKRRGP